jgi:hypothetical protein
MAPTLHMKFSWGGQALELFLSFLHLLVLTADLQFNDFLLIKQNTIFTQRWDQNWASIK